MQLTEITIRDASYRVGRLNAFKQLNVVRRVVPLLTGVLQPEVTRELAVLAVKPGEPEKPADSSTLTALLFEPFTQAMARMTDQDCEYVVLTCLSTVSQKVGEAWSPLVAPNGRLMQEDLDLVTMARLCWEVLRFNLAGFFSGHP